MSLLIRNPSLSMLNCRSNKIRNPATGKCIF